MSARPAQKPQTASRHAPAWRPWVRVVVVCCFLAVFSGAIVAWSIVAGVFPAVIVNGDPVPLREYRNDVDAYYAAAQSNSGISLFPAGITREEIRSNVLDRLIRNVILAQVSEANGVTDLDVRRELEAIRRNPADSVVLSSIMPVLGWTEDDLRDKLIKVYVIEREIEKRLGKDEARRALDEAYESAVIIRFVR